MKERFCTNLGLKYSKKKLLYIMIIPLQTYLAYDLTGLQLSYIDMSRFIIKLIWGTPVYYENLPRTWHLQETEGQPLWFGPWAGIIVSLTSSQHPYSNRVHIVARSVADKFGRFERYMWIFSVVMYIETNCISRFSILGAEQNSYEKFEFSLRTKGDKLMVKKNMLA